MRFLLLLLVFLAGAWAAAIRSVPEMNKSGKLKQLSFWQISV
jgi:hypothetical protein